MKARGARMDAARSGSFGAACLGALLGAAACHSAPKDGPGPSATTLAAVAPPSALIAEGVLATPDLTWQRLQRGGGGGAGLLPTTLGGLLAGALGFDAKLGGEIEGGSPAYVVIAGDAASPSWLLAARLVEDRRARPLFEGKGAIFVAHDAGGDVLSLSAPGKPPPHGLACGIAPGGWFVFASSIAALGELAPYATRTLPSKLGAGHESVGIDVARSAIEGSVASALSSAWDAAQRSMLANDEALRQAHGGRAPDYGDPRAIMTTADAWVQKRLAALRDVEGAHVGADVTEGDVRVTFTAAPATDAGPASIVLGALQPGDVAPLGRLPRETLAGLLTREPAAAHAQDAADLEATVTSTLGARLSLDEQRRLHAAIDDWAEARGEWATFGVAFTPTDRAAVVDIQATDAPRLARSVRESVDLFARVPAIHEPLAAWLHARSVAIGAAPIPGGGHASTATLSTEARPLVLAWTSNGVSGPDADVKLSLGTAPLPFLAPALPGTTLADDPELRALFASLGPVAGAVVVQPQRLPGCVATGGAVVAWGTRPSSPGAASGSKDALWATLAASDSSLRCLVKSFF